MAPRYTLEEGAKGTRYLGGSTNTVVPTRVVLALDEIADVAIFKQDVPEPTLARIRVVTRRCNGIKSWFEVTDVIPRDFEATQALLNRFEGKINGAKIPEAWSR